MDKITVKDIITFVHKAMDLKYLIMLDWMDNIEIFLDEKRILRVSVNRTETGRTLRVTTAHGWSTISPSDHEYHLFMLLIDEVKNYSERTAVEEINIFINEK